MDFMETHGAELLRTYHRWTGRHLIEPCGDALAEARELFEAPFAVVSGGAEGDQILNYGNQTAMDLWEMDWHTLTRTPSRLTAEPMHREERAEFLRRVRERGFIDDYSGIRISSKGRRFRILQATVWNVIDADGNYAGQAATFSNWEFLNEGGSRP
ncbi:MAG: MEKHLA domain-containing protein [Spartobacteria bacterium]